MRVAKQDLKISFFIIQEIEQSLYNHEYNQF
jgi:hypothetical protein